MKYHVLFLLVSVGLALGSPQGARRVPGCRGVPFSGKDSKLMVKLHNDKRRLIAAGDEPDLSYSASNMREISWNEDLAAKAQEWAAQCVFKHDNAADRVVPPFTNVGQNIFIRGATSDDEDVPIAEAFDSWYKEVSEYTGSGENFVWNYKTGHFTQIAWAETSQIGCGFSTWPEDRFHWYYVVCNYGEAGNMMGAAMFRHGKACTKCPKDAKYCSDLLCTPVKPKLKEE